MYEDDDIDAPKRRSVFGLLRAKVDTALQEKHDALAVRRAESAAKVNAAKAKVSDAHAGGSGSKVDSIVGKAHVYQAQQEYARLTGAGSPPPPPQAALPAAPAAAAQAAPQTARRLVVLEGHKVDLNAVTDRDVEIIAVRIGRYMSDNYSKWNRQMAAEAGKAAFRGQPRLTREQILEAFEKRLEDELAQKLEPLRYNLPPEKVAEIEQLAVRAWRGIENGLLRADREGKVTYGRLRDLA